MNKKFKKTKLTLAISLLCCSANIYAQATAEVEAEDDIEVISVSSTQRSLIKAMDLKRASDSVVDGITAEELGLFPDANVADSLSHITGVTIGRTSGGEGQGVNIRGLGPEFSIVTINNRIMATDQNGRDFAFDVLPSEVISEAWVHKSVTAATLEGSIGGAINLVTAKPFDTPGKQGSVSAEGQYGDKSEEVGYKFTAVGSNTFADDTMGLMFSALYSNTPTRSDSLSDLNYGENWSWDHDNDKGWVDWQDSSNELRIPSVVAYRARIEDKKRMALSGVFQYKPSDKVEVVVDALWTRLDSPAIGYTESFYMASSAPSWRDATFGGTATEQNPQGTTVTGITMDNVLPELVTFTEHRVVDTYQGGINGKFEVTDTFTLTADAYISKAVRDAGGKDKFVVAKATGAVPNTATFSLGDGGLPSFVFDFDESTGISSVADLVDNSQFGPHYSETNGVDIDDQVLGASIVGEMYFDLPLLDELEFGVVYNKRTKDRTKIDNRGARELYSDAPFAFSETGIDVVSGFGLTDFLSGISGDFPREFVGFDIDAYQAAVESADGNPNIINPNTGEPYPVGYSDADVGLFNPNESFQVEEETISAYLQANLSGELASMHWSGNIGLRYVSTDTASNGWDWEIDYVKQASPGAWTWSVVHKDPTAVSYDNSYSELLPSFNFSLELTDELLLRFSYAEVMSRASLNQLSTQVDDVSASWGEFTINKVGNPGLLPVTAKQGDISLEWYFTEGSALTAAVFKKDIKGFVQDWQNVYPNEEDSANRPQYPVENPQPWIETGLVDTFFNVFEPQNLDSAKVLGYEFSLQHFFENGFGVTANYTYIDTKSYLSGDFLEGVLAGVPDTSYSLYLYYSKDKLNLQIGASHTESYITSHWSPLNIVGNEEFKSTSDPMTWMSASASYAVTDDLQAYVELDNILDDNWHSYVGEGITGGYEEWGRKINMGVRYKF
jgi:TonB-dependent receptor